MAQITNFFVGANSGNGFQNLFSQVTDETAAYDVMVLKGGPGVGKNTFMREIGRTMERAGTPVEYLWCSGDPDSLDGVVLPALRCAVVDGTSPHVVEPRFPAAVGRYVDLGRFYDLTAAKLSATEVKAHTYAYKRAYERAYRYLKAARLVEEESAACALAVFDRRRALTRLERIGQRELHAKGKESGKTALRFLGSLTHKGYIWRFDSVEALCPKIYVLADSWGLAGEGLSLLRSMASEKGWDSISCVCPEDPTRLEHLLIPGLGLAFVTSRPGMEYPGKPFRRIHLDTLAEPVEKGHQRLEIRLTALLRDEGVAALKAAKASHDALEAVYNPYVDFEGVRAQAALEAGRLLSWLEQ